MNKDGLVFPSYDKWDIHIFNVYRSDDVIKFLQILAERDGNLQTVVRAFHPNGMSSGWNITYTLKDGEKPIEMEVLC